MFYAFTETTYFWRLASNLQTALRVHGKGQTVDECYEDLEGLAFTTESDAILAQCEALLSKRSPERIRVPEMVASDVAALATHGAADPVYAVIWAEGPSDQDLLREYLQAKPETLHFCCHGDGSGSLDPHKWVNWPTVVIIDACET